MVWYLFSRSHHLNIRYWISHASKSRYDWKIVTKFVFFGTIGKKNKMAAQASDWLRHFLTSLKSLNGIQRNLTGSNVSMSSTKFVLFGPIEKNKMAVLASDWLSHLQLLLWNRWTKFNGDLASCQVSLTSIQQFQRKSRKYLSQSDASAAILFFWKHKLGRGHWDLASWQVLLNSAQWFQRRSRKCLNQSEARGHLVFSDRPEKHKL